MEDMLNHLDLAVSRLRDIRTVLFAWEEVLALAEVEGYIPGQVLRSLNVRVSLPGWITGREVALTFSATRPILDDLLKTLPGEGLDVKKLRGSSNLILRYRLSSRPP